MDSDDESLAGLTQEPSQDRINALNFHLRDPNELIDCSGNQQDDFDNFVGEFCAEKCVTESFGTDDADKLSELFPSLAQHDEAKSAENNAAKDNPTLSMLETVSYFTVL